MPKLPDFNLSFWTLRFGSIIVESAKVKIYSAKVKIYSLEEVTNPKFEPEGIIAINHAIHNHIDIVLGTYFIFCYYLNIESNKLYRTRIYDYCLGESVIECEIKDIEMNLHVRDLIDDLMNKSLYA